ncbi:CaiB/BaiF CoA transferase family protein [Rhodococcus sp. T7]|uniref:CaiB/BaiF CoA transferase family protein n=1 Tax=Rhodococcus sp. T7 TaxID=627444 RepID=UPI0013593F02|nr:CaiB/BaiF CoA-transferase family protein [Rhodococcus sp. T7]KAF0957009.1 Acetyl-CoA:oxalate CoA-transferase [Rhodococcus sp. T7]KAF0958714.1 Acetyl-CoA:oxalate CoA-transferase [Rhodococcus sp. T7]
MTDTETTHSAGPLAGLKIVELAGIGPGPYAAMLLADLGADVVRVERPGPPASGVDPQLDVLRRNRTSIVVDLRSPRGVDVVKQLTADADVLIEGFRPGVTERLGLGPEDLWSINPRLVYGRMTGWGQEGPLAHTAGHDIGYIAITGALASIGRRNEAPVPPVNFVGDFGGGSLFLVVGILAAVWEAVRSGRGQVVDAAIVDGAASLTGILHGLMASGGWQDERGTNFLDTGVPWYDTYATSDDRWMAVGALEPQFYATFTETLGLAEDVADRTDPRGWPQLREAIRRAFASRTQAEWTAAFEGTDACVAPVLSLTEAPDHPHLTARGTFVDVGSVRQPAPAPRFSRTVPPTPTAPPVPGAHTSEILRELGISDVDDLLASGVVERPDEHPDRQRAAVPMGPQ